MREILFRGKRVDNGEWVEGNLFVPDKVDTPTQICIGTNVVRITYEVIPETVGQYTGLTANGTKIFEGDIGKYKQVDGAKRKGKSIICRGSVVYNAKIASYAVESKDEAGCKYFDYFSIKDFEVIGNIHDNSELLKGGESDA